MDKPERQSGLCITRKLGESVTINTPLGDVIVTVHEVKGRSKIRLYFSGPRAISIHRTETDQTLRDFKDNKSGAV